MTTCVVCCKGSLGTIHDWHAVLWQMLEQQMLEQQMLEHALATQ